MAFIIDGSYIEATLKLDANSAQRSWEFVQKFRANPQQPGISLEFKAVFVIDADDRQLPLAKALAEASDEQLRQDAIARERQLLYVSVTRARDELFVCWTGEPSRFLIHEAQNRRHAK